MGCVFETSNKNLRNSIGHKHTSRIGKQRLNCNNNQRCSCQKENLYHNSLSQTYDLKALPKRISGVHKWCPDKYNNSNSNKNENNNNNNNYNISNILNAKRNNNNNNTTKILLYSSKSKITKYLYVQKQKEEEEEDEKEKENSQIKTLSIIVFAVIQIEQESKKFYTIEEYRIMKCILLEDENENENEKEKIVKNILIVISCFPKTKYIQIDSGLRLSCKYKLTAKPSAQLIGGRNFCIQNDNVTLSTVTPRRTMIISAIINTIAACKPQTELRNLDLKATNTANNLNTASGNIIKSNSCTRKQQHQLKQKSCYQQNVLLLLQNLYQNIKCLVVATTTTERIANDRIPYHRTHEHREESTIVLYIRDAIRKLGHNIDNSMMAIQTVFFYLNYRLKQQHQQNTIKNSAQIVKHHRDVVYNLRNFQIPGCSDNNNNNNNITHNYTHNNRLNCNDNRGQRLLNLCNFNSGCRMLLLLCFLATTVVGAATVVETTTSSGSTFIDKHPIQGIDWSKFDESSSDKEILDLLLEKKRYDKRLLPPVNDEDFCCGLSSPDMAQNHIPRRPHKRGTLTVNVNVLLLSLASPDESSLKYEVEFLLNQQWNDPRLQYGNKSHYDFLNALHHHDSIWTPDTYFIMHGDFKDPIIPMHFALRIYRNGTITYAMRRHLILSCQGSLHIFPFDDPKCSFSMESISYEEAQIKYVWKNDEDTLRKSPSLTTLNAYLIKNQTTACDQNSWRGNYSCLRVDLIFTRDRAFYFTTVFIPGIILVTSSFITFWLEWNAVPARSMIGNYSCLQVELTFTRDRAYYFTTVFIPGIILVTSSFITFWLEWNAVPARVMIGVTTMLNFFTTSNGFRSTLPVVSNLTAMNVWDGVCMCFIYASLLEFVCVNYVGRKRPLHNVVYRPGENPVTQRLPAVLSRIGVILASPLEIIEREFHAALSSEKAAVGTSTAGTSMRATPSVGTPAISQPASRTNWDTMQHSGMITAAVQNLRTRSIKREKSTTNVELPLQTPQPNKLVDYAAIEPVYEEPKPLTAAMKSVEQEELPSTSGLQLRRLSNKSTSTPALIETPGKLTEQTATDIEQAERQISIKPPPRKKTSRSASPTGAAEASGGVSFFTSLEQMTSTGFGVNAGEKRRDTGAPNEIVACTTCGGSSSPCTHSVNNGCATETCFVRKKEPPHPIRVAKTIDVIARITFPIAYSIFLIFFFVHYKGFS